MVEPYILLADLADQLGMDRSNARKYILERGFTFTKLRSKKKNNALMLALAVEDAEAILEQRRVCGFTTEGFATPDANGHGTFYIVQPLPDLDPLRLKFGFTVSLDQRLLNYRSICPEMVILKTWPCKAVWERTAIAALSREGCERLGQEVFRCLDIQPILEQGEKFFAMLPRL